MGKVYLTIGLVVAGVTLLFAVMKLGGNNESVVSSNPKIDTKQEVAGLETKTAKADAAPQAPQMDEELVDEMIFLPGEVKVTQDGEAPMSNPVELKEGEMRIVNARPVTDKASQGEFLRPTWSPDGMQMMASRPGQAGIWLVGLNGEEPVKVSDDNIFNASWTEDGRIKVLDEDGTARVYGTDGVLEETAREARMSFAEDDTIYARASADSAAVPITTNDDRYFGPSTSPDGEYVVYSGLYSGIYMAPTNGSAPPVYLGSGNNPSWLADSSGVVFDVTSDDGHYVTAGDAYFADVEATERTNLTSGDDRIVQTPSVHPSSGEIIFESEGVIFRGELEGGIF